MATMLQTGVSVLLGGIWTGAAAERFGHRCNEVRSTLLAHADNLGDAADLVSTLADDIDAAGTKIAPMLQVVVDIGLSILQSAISGTPIPAIIEIGKAALQQLMEGCHPIVDALDGIVDVVEAANSSTDDLVSAADALGN